MQTVRDRPDTNRLSISVINCERPPWKASLCVFVFQQISILSFQREFDHTPRFDHSTAFIFTHLALIILLLLSSRGPWLFYFCYLYFPYHSSLWSVYVSTLPWYGVLSVHNTRRFSRAVRISQDVFHVLGFTRRFSRAVLYKRFFFPHVLCFTRRFSSAVRISQDVFHVLRFTRRFSRAVFYKYFTRRSSFHVLRFTRRFSRAVFYKTFFTCCTYFTRRFSRAAFCCLGALLINRYTFGLECKHNILHR